MTSVAPTQTRLLGVRFLVWMICTGIVVVGALFWLWFTYMDKVYFERDTGASEEIRRNAFFAAAKYLNKLGVPTENRKNYDIIESLPDTDATIIIESSRVSLSQARLDNLRDWVKQGGHLILAATEEYDQDFSESRDKIFDELKLRVYPKPDEDAWDVSENDYTFDGYEIPSKADFRSGFYLEDASGNASFADDNNDYAQLVQYDYGEGLITALASLDLFNNYAIGNKDHAMILAQLVGDSSAAYFVYNQVQPGLTSLLARYAPELLIAFIVLLVVILFSVSNRQGPKLADDVPVQREIRQHLEAAAEFGFRVDSGTAASQEILHYLGQLMHRQVPGFARLSSKEQIQRVAQKTQLPPAQIEIIWRTDAIESAHLLTKAELIQHIRKLL